MAISKVESVCEYVTRHIEASPKSQKQIALEAGFPHPNVISMIKAGVMLLPVARVEGLARAIGADYHELLLKVIAEQSRDVFRALGPSLAKDVAERGALQLIRIAKRQARQETSRV